MRGCRLLPFFFTPMALVRLAHQFLHQTLNLHSNTLATRLRREWARCGARAVLPQGRRNQRRRGRGGGVCCEVAGQCRAAASRDLKAERGREMGAVYLLLLASLGLNAYLGLLCRSFYYRYNDLSDELRETFTTSVV